jgi:hypothetical protein
MQMRWRPFGVPGITDSSNEMPGLNPLPSSYVAILFKMGIIVKLPAGTKHPHRPASQDTFFHPDHHPLRCTADGPPPVRKNIDTFVTASSAPRGTKGVHKTSGRNPLNRNRKPGRICLKEQANTIWDNSKRGQGKSQKTRDYRNAPKSNQAYLRASFHYFLSGLPGEGEERAPAGRRMLQPHGLAVLSGLPTSFRTR